jgi:membrane-associated HD superfamily phosphohydrolase
LFKNISLKYYKIIHIFVFLSFLFTFFNLSSAQTNQDSISKKDSIISPTTKDTLTDTSDINPLQIDTGNIINQIDTTQSDTVSSIDSLLLAPLDSNPLTNTEIFVYILLCVIGLALFFFIFVNTLFRTFHKTRSTRQSLLLSWNLFFVVSIIWLFIIWGIVADFWNSSAFMIVMIFLFVISLIMIIIAVKSK